MDPTVLGTNEWAAWQWAFLVDRAPWIAAWAALVVAKLLVFAIVLTALVPPAEYAAPADGVSTRAGSETNDAGAPADGRSEDGLSAADVAALELLRRRVRAGEVNEGEARTARPARPATRPAARLPRQPRRPVVDPPARTGHRGRREQRLSPRSRGA